jgi:hypothetical protein
MYFEANLRLGSGSLYIFTLLLGRFFWPDSKAVMQGTANPLFVGSIPTPASIKFTFLFL